MNGHLTRRSVLKKIVAAFAAAISLPAFAHNGVDHSHEITIKGFAFVPDKLAVRVGDTVTFTNEDVAPHTATALEKGWDTDIIKKGDSATITIVADMEMEYFCRFHPKMKGGFDLVSE